MKSTRNGHVPAAASLGKLPQPDSLREIFSKHWDAIVVGAGHNGLACAAYLAQGGHSVLVLEARERVGGACTIHEVWPGYRISPCAYLAGLLHPLVIDELEMAEYGFRWLPARPACSSRSTTAPACSSGMTMPSARKRSSGWRRPT